MGRRAQTHALTLQLKREMSPKTEQRLRKPEDNAFHNLMLINGERDKQVSPQNITYQKGLKKE